MTKLYVSRYSNKELEDPNVIKVGISRGLPKFSTKYVLAGNIFQLAPPSSIFAMTDEFAFRRKYFEHLDKIGVEGVKRLLEKMGYGKAEQIVLLCYEDITSGKWCHRTMFAEWWEKNTGEKVKEFPDHNTYEIKEKKKEEKNRGGQVEGQMNLFEML